MEFLLFVLVFMQFIAVLIVEKESIERDKKIRKRIKRLNKKMDELALCTFYLLGESDIYAEIQKSEQIGRKK